MPFGLVEWMPGCVTLVPFVRFYIFYTGSPWFLYQLDPNYQHDGRSTLEASTGRILHGLRLFYDLKPSQRTLHSVDIVLASDSSLFIFIKRP